MSHDAEVPDAVGMHESGVYWMMWRALDKR